MRDSERRYRIACVVCLLIAAAISAVAWRAQPFVIDLWVGVISFSVYAALAELLAVVTDEGRGVSVSPGSPILWAATCVLGPTPAIAVCFCYSILALLIRGVCYEITPHIQDVSPAFLRSKRLSIRMLRTLRRWIIGAGKPWQRRGFRHTALYLIFYISNGIITVVPAGLIYKAVGGLFLYGATITSPMLQFIAPYLILVGVSIFAEHACYTAFMVSMHPRKGKSTVYSTLLRAKIVLIEDVLPVWKGQMFLIGVGLLIAYLYKHIGALGFVLSAMPVLALRDFFRLWIEERMAYVDTITTLAAYMQHYHPYTRGHLKRVADLSERLAREMRLPAESVRHIGTAGFLHDIGKIGVSEEILDKTSKLTEEEWDVIKEHPVKGAEIIRHIEFLEGIAEWIKYHHKWYNGGGYPSTNGDSGTLEVPIEAAIIATVDAFDAMTDDRELSTNWHCDTCGHVPEDDSRPACCPVCKTEKRRMYREPKSLEEAIEELKRGAGSQFHPQVVKAFLAMIERERMQLNAG